MENTTPQLPNIIGIPGDTRLSWPYILVVQGSKNRYAIQTELTPAIANALKNDNIESYPMAYRIPRWIIYSSLLTNAYCYLRNLSYSRQMKLITKTQPKPIQN